MSVLRVLLVCASCAAALGVAFVALLALTLSLTSDQRIVEHLNAAAETGAFAGDSYPRSPYGHGGHRYDMYTDCVAYGMNLSNEADGMMRRIAASPSAGREGGDGPCEDLRTAVASGEVNADHAYLRFWHGYQVYMRPALSLMSYEYFMRLTAILFYAALLFFALRINPIFGGWAWLVTLFPFFIISDFFTVPMVATHAISLIWAFLPAALVPLILERYPNAERLWLPVFVFCAGATYNFMNFLINPPLAPALIAFLYIACRLDRDEKRTIRTVLYAGGLAFLWFAGFAAVWIEKWLLAAAVLGPDAITAEVQRTMEKYEATRQRLQVNFLGATRRNVEYTPVFFAYLVGSIAIAGAALAWLIRKFGDARVRIVQFIALMTPLAVVVFWVEANRAHSAEHIGFVSRNFLLFSVFPLLAMLKLWRDARAQPAGKTI